MTQPEVNRIQVDLTEYSQQWYEVRVLKKQMDAVTAEYEGRLAKLKKFIGDADDIVINGNVVATHPRGAFNRAKFIKENPVLAAQYAVKEFVEKFDEDKFAQENPGLWLGYKSRSLRAKDGE